MHVDNKRDDDLRRDAVQGASARRSALNPNPNPNPTQQQVLAGFVRCVVFAERPTNALLLLQKNAPAVGRFRVFCCRMLPINRDWTGHTTQEREARNSLQLQARLFRRIEALR